MDKIKARVLLVDNDDKTPRNLKNILTRRGYNVSVVSNGDYDIRTQAVKRADQFRPHIAVVDLRLLNDYMRDISGLKLIAKLAPAVCILYSAQLTFDVVQDAIAAGAFRCIPKGGGATRKVIAAIEQAAAACSSAFVSFTAPWPRRMSSQQIVDLIFGEDHDVPALLADDLVHQLVEGNGLNVVMESLRNDMRTNLTIQSGHTFVCKLRFEGEQPRVLKLSAKPRAEREKMNYDKYIENKIPGGFHTRLHRSHCFWDLGGALYSFIGTTVQALPTFATFYRNTDDTKLLLAPLYHLFTMVWAEMYRDKKRCESLSIFQLYDQVFELHSTERLEILESRYEGVAKVLTTTLPSVIDLHSPVAWFQKYKHQLRSIPAFTAITHGDLHGDNLFVADDKAWLIDFERTGPGHVLRDFVELESDILTRLIPQDTGISLLILLMVALIDGTNDELDALMSKHAEIEKAFAVIDGLRSIARTTTQYSDTREYKWALLLQTLYVASRQSASEVQMARALIFATLLCHRLRYQEKPLLTKALTADLNAAIWAAAKLNSQNSFEYDVYISYCDENSQWVRNELLPNLQAQDLSVSIDVLNFQPGAVKIKEIERAIKASRRTLLVLTPAYIKNMNSEFEGLLVQTLDLNSRECRLIPLIKETCDLPPRISMLVSINFDAPHESGASWERLYATLGTAST